MERIPDNTFKLKELSDESDSEYVLKSQNSGVRLYFDYMVEVTSEKDDRVALYHNGHSTHSLSTRVLDVSAEKVNELLL